MLTFDLGTSMLIFLPAELWGAAGHLLVGPGFVIACIAAATAGVATVGLVLLIILRHWNGGQTIEDSEAAVRHFLPF